MPCLLGCLALSTPRLVLALVWIFSGYLDRAYNSFIWPLLGFIFLPLTTLVCAYAINSTGSFSPVNVVLVVLALLIDLGLLGGGEASRRHRRRSPH
jgi:hypothetical protein